MHFSIKSDEEIVFAIKSDDPIPYFVYTIMSRGKIIKHSYVKGGDQKSYELKIQPTAKMSSNTNLFVYLIDDGEMKYDTFDINIPRKREAKVRDGLVHG